MIAYRMWHGPVVGRVVSHAWIGYARVVFLEFGKLSPSDIVRRDGTRGNRRGEWAIATMRSMSQWSRSIRERVLTGSDCRYDDTARAIRRLIGRRLLSFEIDAMSGQTRVRFTHDIVLTTTMLRRHGIPRRPHWDLRAPEGWRDVVLRGTRLADLPWKK